MLISLILHFPELLHTSLSSIHSDSKNYFQLNFDETFPFYNLIILIFPDMECMYWTGMAKSGRLFILLILGEHSECIIIHFY